MDWRYLLGSEWVMQDDIKKQGQELKRLRRQLRRSSSYSAPDSGAKITFLERENEELRLYIVALTRLLLAKGVIAKEEIEQFIEAVDLEDGFPDGRYSKPLSESLEE